MAGEQGCASRRTAARTDRRRSPAASCRRARPVPERQSERVVADELAEDPLVEVQVEPASDFFLSNN